MGIFKAKRHHFPLILTMMNHRASLKYVFSTNAKLSNTWNNTLHPLILLKRHYLFGRRYLVSINALFNLK
jgi:hypothetical protein